MGRILRAPIVSDKKEVTWSNLASAQSTTTVVVIARGKKIGDVNASTEEPVGSKIYSVYFEINFSAEEIASTKVIHWNIAVESPNNTQTIPSLYYQDDRSFILKRGMEMLPKSVNTIIKRQFVVKIPKVYQRMKEEQDLIFQYVSTSTDTGNCCGFAILKNIQ